MRSHQVQVDDEVFQFVKAHAEPLVDDFNSALRRLLPLKHAHPRKHPEAGETVRQNQNGVLPSLPNGTPTALRHILEVAYLVRSGEYTRTEATKFVANQHHVFPQTVNDKYCRQLGLTASQFDRLLEEEVPTELRALLGEKFSGYSNVIHQILN